MNELIIYIILSMTRPLVLLRTIDNIMDEIIPCE